MTAFPLAAHLAANVEQSLYTVPVGKTATVTVSFCNFGTAAANVFLSHKTGANSYRIESGAALPAHGVLERTGIVLTAGKSIIVKSDSENVDVSVYGFEEGE